MERGGGGVKRETNHVSTLCTLHCEMFMSSGSEKFSIKNMTKKPRINRDLCTGCHCDSF